MREVLAARSDRDFVNAGPRRRLRSVMPSRGRRLLATAWQRRGLLAGGLVISTATTAIIVNALSFQSARHPAPIFAKVERATSPSRSVEPAPQALPPVPPTRPPSTGTTTPAPQAPPRSASITDLIRNTEMTGTAAPVMRPAEGRAEPQRQVESAQRALTKLGYGPLKVDGMFGRGTKQAIERFERDRRLTPTGELGLRTARELSALSGIRVE